MPASSGPKLADSPGFYPGNTTDGQSVDCSSPTYERSGRHLREYHRRQSMDCSSPTYERYERYERYGPPPPGIPPTAVGGLFKSNLAIVTPNTLNPPNLEP